MHLLELEVEQVRGVQGPLRLELDPGLNVLHGPNEIGKSTLVEAIWQGLVLHARGDTAQHRALRPRNGATPRVRLRFSHQGILYTVEKIFSTSTKGRCSLRVDPPRGAPEELSGPEAEERLRAVLGVGTPGKSGELKPEDSGLWRLVRVTQGRSGTDPKEDLGGAQAGLADRLAALSGEVLAGEGATELLRQVEAEYLRHFTHQGKEATRADAPVARSRRELTEARAAREALEGQERQHNADVERHAELSARVTRLRRELPEHVQRQATAAADARRLEELRAGVQAAEGHEQLRGAEERELEGHRREREELVRTLVEAQEALHAAGERQAQRREQLHEAQRAPQEQEDALRTASAALDAAERAEGRLRAALELAEARRRHAEALTRLEEVRVAAAQVSTLRDEQARERLTDAELARLEKLERDTRARRARLDAAAASLRLRALAACTVQLGDERIPLSPGEEVQRTATTPTLLRVGELVELELRPGGEDLDRLRREADAASGALEQALRVYGLEGLPAAYGRLAAREQRERELARLDDRLRALAPRGPDAAARELEGLDRARQAAALELERLTRDGDAPLPEDPAQALPEAALHTREAREAREAAQRTLHEAQSRVQLARRDLEEAERDLERTLSARNAADARLSVHRDKLGEDSALELRAAQAGHALRLARAHLDEQRRALAAQHPDDVAVALKQTTRALELAREELLQAERGCTELEGRLGAAGLIGLHDRLDAAREQERGAEERLTLALQEAEAAKLLYDTLESCRQQAQERTLAPLTREVQTLLRQAFPEAQAHFDQELGLTRLDRGEGGADTFPELSAGAREQLGLVIRLAMARLLAQGERLLVVLDDALVATDEVRLGRMARVLAAAATDLQILFVTCHWDRLRALGLAPDRVLDLAEARRTQEARA